MAKVTILGSTGSIGQSTLKVIRHLGADYQVVAMSAHSNMELLTEQVLEFSPKMVAVKDQEKRLHLRSILGSYPVQIVVGEEGLQEISAMDTCDTVMVAITGFAALLPTLSAIRAKKRVLLASKEILVVAGDLLKKESKDHGVELISVDSEHSAIFQCLQGQRIDQVNRLILTASGGPFLKMKEEHLSSITPQDALNHPTWKMGAKISIDSSTLMNKGFEVMEAAALFDLPESKIEVVIHPQSIVHSFVEFNDGALLAQLSEPDMVLPIQYGLTYPNRLKSNLASFDFTKARSLEFFPPDTKKFISLTLAYDALRMGKSYPCLLNAANEVLVSRFLSGEISWLGIMDKLQNLFNKHRPQCCDSLDAIISMDHFAREEAKVI